MWSPGWTNDAHLPARLLHVTEWLKVSRHTQRVALRCTSYPTSDESSDRSKVDVTYSALKMFSFMYLYTWLFSGNISRSCRLIST